MLDQFPPEVLLFIGELLDLIDPHSLLDLACTSRHCYSTVISISYQTLRFSANLEHLDKDVQMYSQLLNRVNGHGRVSRLIISGGFVTNPQEQQEWRRPTMTVAEYCGDDDDEIITEHRKYLSKTGNRELETLESAYESDHLWRTLAEFISHLPSLDSIFYTRPSQFPPCLLKSIHQHRPQCKLYLTNFNIWSLHADQTDDYEFRLLTSPCLYGIMIRYYDDSGYDADGRPVYHAEALMSLISGLSPNLKKVYISHQSLYNRSGLARQTRLSRANFRKDCFVINDKSPSPSSLESFGLSEAHLGLPELKEWVDYIDLSTLRVLKIDSFSFETDRMEYLATRQFPALEELDIKILRYGEHAGHGDSSLSFLLGLPPLTKLRVWTWQSNMCGVLTCNNFGSRLRQLSVFSDRASEILSLRDLQNLVVNCPLVEDLAIMIRRTRGDSREVAHYQSLRGLSKLKRLSLWLHCSDSTESNPDFEHAANSPIDPTFNDFDQQYVATNGVGRYCKPRTRNGHIRDALINSAIDRRLVHDIFRACIRPGTGGPLEYLEITPHYGFTIQSRLRSEFFHVLDHICRPHRLRRGRGDDIIIAQTRDIVYGNIHYLSHENFIEPVWRRLWPTNTENWWECWHSFPLEMSVDEEIDWRSA
jgi:hypothetical protein